LFFGASNDLFTIRSVHRQGFRGIVNLIGLTMCVAEGGVWKNYRIAFLGSRIQSSSDQQARRKPLFVGYLQTISVPLYSITSYVNMWINMCVSYFYFPCVCVCVLFLCEELLYKTCHFRLYILPLGISMSYYYYYYYTTYNNINTRIWRPNDCNASEIGLG